MWKVHSLWAVESTLNSRISSTNKGQSNNLWVRVNTKVGSSLQGWLCLLLSLTIVRAMKFTRCPSGCCNYAKINNPVLYTKKANDAHALPSGEATQQPSNGQRRKHFFLWELHEEKVLHVFADLGLYNANKFLAALQHQKLNTWDSHSVYISKRFIPPMTWKSICTWNTSARNFTTWTFLDLQWHVLVQCRESK